MSETSEGKQQKYNNEMPSEIFFKGFMLWQMFYDYSSRSLAHFLLASTMS
jgi:hypothetical protein